MAHIERRRRKIQLLVIEYLQLIQPCDAPVPREQQVAGMTRALKCTARDLEIPIAVLAQLNRSIERRENKRPRLADLRESGAIEQGADVVLFSRLKSSAKPNQEREFFVTLPKAYAVINACPDAEWRLLFALCRFGGFRCPSQIVPLCMAGHQLGP